MDELPTPITSGEGWPWARDSKKSLTAESEARDETLPTITLVTPSYNQQRFIEAAIRSILLQDYSRLEYFIRDGGSNDGSISVIEHYSPFIDQWVSEPDNGQAAAINEGWKQSSGELLGWLNSDDVLSPGALTRVATAARDHPDKVLFFGDCTIIDEKGREIRTKRLKGHNAEAHLEGKSFAQPSVFIRRSVIEEVGLLDESLRFALDWAYFLKVLWSYSEHRTKYIPGVLSFSREYEGTKTRTGLDRKGRERRQKLLEYKKKGLFSRGDDSLLDRGVAGTYWVQGADEFLERRYLDALVSGLNAVRWYPQSVLNKLSRLPWLFEEWLRRSR
jgi:glycosyltransferase involved in cell wall biosynthesis